MPYTKPAKTLFTTWTDNDGVSLTLKQYVEGDTTTYSTLVVDNKSYTFAFAFIINKQVHLILLLSQA